MQVALILSGGIGMRFGERIPKQYIEAAGRPVIAYALELFEKHEQIDRIQIVAAARWHELVFAFAGSKFAGFSRPGQNRQLSILNGLEDLLKYASPKDAVIVHDAVRPLVRAQTVTRILETLKEHEAVAPVLPLRDTIYSCANGRFIGTPRRDLLVAGQAPEGFRLGKYYRAVKALLPDAIYEITGSLQAALLADLDAVSVPGDEENFKITTKEDLFRFEQILKERCV